ncbi:hypothetical protein [Nocardia fluminea]|uniref:hypothetical protein n=1 Tax=Nocardia fluminea TaxID=134984 RepID=UPI0033CE1C04
MIPAPSIFAAVDRSYDRIVGLDQSTLVADRGGMFATNIPASADSAVVAGNDFVPNVETLLTGVCVTDTCIWGEVHASLHRTRDHDVKIPRYEHL